MDQAKGFAEQPGKRPRNGPLPGEEADDSGDARGDAPEVAAPELSADAPTPWDETGLDEPAEDAANAPQAEDDQSDVESGALQGFSLVLDSSAASEADAEAEAALAEDLDLPEVPAGDEAASEVDGPSLTLVSESWLARTGDAAEAIEDDDESEDLLAQAAASAAGTSHSELRELLRSRAELSSRAENSDRNAAHPPTRRPTLDEQEEAALAAARAVVRKGTRGWPTLMAPVRWWKKATGAAADGRPARVLPLGASGDAMHPPRAPGSPMLEAEAPEEYAPQLTYESAIEPDSAGRVGRAGGAFTLPLLCAGIGLIACCLLIPQTDMNRRMAYERERLRRDLESIQLQVATNEEFLRKVGDDPTLAERLAQRQMKTVRAGTRVLTLRPGETELVLGEQSSAADMSPFQLVSVRPPDPLPPYQPKGGVLGSLCNNSRSRLLLTGGGLMLMAAGLVLGAVPGRRNLEAP
jgi:hypothetical protein